MNKLQLFVVALLRSIFDPRYFKDVYQATWRFSLTFFTLVVLLLSALMAGTSARWLAGQDFTVVPRQMVSVFPTDLEVTVSDSGVSLNKPLPYSIPLPVDWQKTTSIPYRNVVSFVSATASPTLADVASYSAFAVVSPTEVYLPQFSDAGNLEEVKMYEVPGLDSTLVVNRAVLDKSVMQWLDHPFFAQKWYAWLIGVVLFLILVPFVWIFQGIIYAVISVLFWFVSRFISAWKQLTYGQIYRISLVMLTFALVGDVLLDLLDLNYVKFPWLWLVGVAWLSLGAYMTFGLEAPVVTSVRVASKTRRQGNSAPRAKKR